MNIDEGRVRWNGIPLGTGKITFVPKTNFLKKAIWDVLKGGGKEWKCGVVPDPGNIAWNNPHDLVVPVVERTLWAYDDETGASRTILCVGHGPGYGEHRMVVKFDHDIPLSRHEVLLQAIVEKFF